MVTRDELHSLVDSLPDAAFEAAQQMLTRFQVWPPPRPAVPPELERFREEVRHRHEKATEGKRGIFGMTAGGGFDPTRGSGSIGSTYWEDETLITETLRLHKGLQLVITERIRLDSDKTLIYAHSVRGPGNKMDQHEIRFDIPTNT
jgi:hypothetical protein